MMRKSPGRDNIFSLPGSEGDNLKISIACVGKIKEKFYRDAVSEYEKRLSRYCKLEFLEVADEKTPEGAGEALEEQIKEKEARRLFSACPLCRRSAPRRRLLERLSVPAPFSPYRAHPRVSPRPRATGPFPAPRGCFAAGSRPIEVAQARKRCFVL